MRRARVPVVSLLQHALVYDPGGLYPVSPIATGQLRRARGVRRSAVPTPRFRPPGVVIPCGTTPCKQLSRRDTDPADFLHPASDVCLLAPAGCATGRVARLCPWKDFHLLENLNQFHRGSHPRLPTVTGLPRHDTPWFGVRGLPHQGLKARLHKMLVEGQGSVHSCFAHDNERNAVH